VKLSKGFSLVELIVVMTIIAVITAIGVVSFTGLNKRSRDSRRVADLKKMAIALEVYRQENGTYPVLENTLVPDYLEGLPTDPKSFSYYYDRLTEYSYQLDAQMEDLGSTTGSYGNNCTGTCNYRIVSP